ncbi:proton myo-inositol cotransporter-like [Gigantopelta aegis]|uniref:proton myo-inositol cotransporter-like n=1 Tax=Gigantopelta aegis TaxID=1735272 RepID=UPI001B889D50|nr:proton myo-inositol cotransporter-like [Gigantopelta aegis]
MEAKDRHNKGGNGDTMNSNSNITTDTKRENTKFVYFLSCFATIGGLIFGYDTGIVSGAMLLIKPFFDLNTIWTEIIVSGTIGAAALFSLVAGFTTDFFGRKKTIMAASFVFTGGAILMALSPSKEILLVGRIIVGMGIGFASMTVPMYVAEVAPAQIRGRLVTLNQLFITIGIVISALIAGGFSEMKPDGWRYMLGLAGAPSLIQFCGFFFLPESPRWLVSKGRDVEARTVLVKIRGTDDVTRELDDIRTVINRDKQLDQGNKVKEVASLCGTPHVMKALFVGAGLQLFQQLCGINTVIYYSASIIKMSGFPVEYAIWLVMVPNTVNFLSTFIGLWAVEKFGRKRLTVISFSGVIMSLAVLAIGFQLSAIYSPEINRNITETYDGNGTVITDSCYVKYTVCSDCIKDSRCGFCYDDIANGTCLQAQPSHKEERAQYGRCNATNVSTTGMHWAQGYCPTDYSWMAILGLVLFVISFAPGLGPMPWTINSEIYPLWARGTCIAMATAVNWIFNLIVSFSFLTLTETITTYGTFWLFACICLVGMIFTLIFVPETKNKTLEEVQLLFMTKTARESRQGLSVYDVEVDNVVHDHVAHSDVHKSEDTRM